MLHGSQYPNQGQTSRPSHTSTHLAHESPAQPNAHVIPGHTNHSTQATSQNPALFQNDGPRDHPLVKWQLGLSSHPKFAPAKKFYAASEAHFVEFTQQVKENVKSHITVKLIMNDPGQVLKDAINSSTQNRSLTLIYGDPVARAALEREEARLAINALTSAGRAMTMDDFLEHCVFGPTDQ
ncbi:hypothetical protein KEM48_006950 [Puccinia striiformis f. sp. tritici PST-130]|nr:hypothetical protein KEM48_006950 [Puccinia striiformis f. sp. tritici PST-130]